MSPNNMTLKYVSRDHAIAAAIAAGKSIVMKTQAEFDAWIAALESGEYRQNRSRLRTDESNGPSFCCLGVEQHVRTGSCEYSTTFPEGEYAGLPSLSYLQCNDIIYLNTNGSSTRNPILFGTGKIKTSTAAELNDQGNPFAHIAALLKSSFMLWPTV